MEEKRSLLDKYNEYKEYVPSMAEYFKRLYSGVEGFYPSVTSWIEKVQKVNSNRLKEFMEELGGVTSVFYDSYFYLIIRGESYLYEFADYGFTDIKNFIKDNYSECLQPEAFKGLAHIFKVRKEIIPFEMLQEYNGKNRSRGTLAKEDQYITEREIYYLNPLIDDLWFLHGYDKMEFGSLVGTRIINIRGTNGSGKTTMVKRIIEDLNKREESVWDEFRTKEITTYHKEYTRKVQVWHKQKFVVMGIYNEKQTGGVDNYDTPWQVMYALFLFTKKYKGYTLIFEGVRISTDYKYWWRVFELLQSVGVKVDIVGLIPEDIQWALNNVIERRKGKGLWELRHPEDIVNNNHDILRSLLLFMSEGYSPAIIKSDKMESIEETFQVLKSFINGEF